MTTPPVLLGLVTDVFFIAPIESAARALGYAVRWIDHTAQVEPAEAARVRQPGEPLAGQGAGWVAQVVEWQPAVVVVELGNPRAPWADWITALKTSPATRRIPVVGFGPHVDLALRAEAEAAGCDVIVAKSALLRDLPGLITRHARLAPAEAVAADCRAPLSALAEAGVTLFDRGAFFEAHEALEHAWNADPGPARELYRGLLQVAVAYLQIERGNYDGAFKMFLRMRQWLDPLPPVCRGLNIAQLRADALAARAALEALGPERLGAFDRALFKPVPRA